MIRIGLTGSIGAGKSTVSAFLKEMGAAVIDADAISRELTKEDNEIKKELLSKFGGSVFHQDGSLNREKLALRVFSDKTEREKLEGILHPHIISRIHERERCFTDKEFVVFDVPLLFETGLDKEMDAIWVVDASKETRIGRLSEKRGMSREEAESRIKAQYSDEKKRRGADIIIENNGSERELKRRVECLWKSINA